MHTWGTPGAQSRAHLGGFARDVPEMCPRCAPGGCARGVPQVCFVPEMCPRCAPGVPEIVPQVCPRCAPGVHRQITELPDKIIKYKFLNKE